MNQAIKIVLILSAIFLLIAACSYSHDNHSDDADKTSAHPTSNPGWGYAPLLKNDQDIMVQMDGYGEQTVLPKSNALSDDEAAMNINFDGPHTVNKILRYYDSDKKSNALSDDEAALNPDYDGPHTVNKNLLYDDGDKEDYYDVLLKSVASSDIESYLDIHPDRHHIVKKNLDYDEDNNYKVYEDDNEKYPQNRDLHSAKKIDGNRYLHSANKIDGNRDLHSANKIDGKRDLHSANKIDGNRDLHSAHPNRYVHYDRIDDEELSESKVYTEESVYALEPTNNSVLQTGFWICVISFIIIIIAISSINLGLLAIIKKLRKPRSSEYVCEVV